MPPDATELPRHLDATTPHQPSATWKTVLLWAVLIGLFILDFALFSRPGSTRTLALAVGVTLIVLALVAWPFGASRQGRRWRERMRETHLLEDEGQLQQAAARWEALARKAFSGNAFEWKPLLLRCAWLDLRLGRAQRAEALLARFNQSPPRREEALARCMRALLVALRGELERAEELLEELEDAGATSGVVGGLARQVLLLRQGAYEEALASAVLPWDIADERCRHHRHAWALLRAFALAQLPPTPEREQDAHRTEAALQDVRPGELDYLAAQWPELSAFLSRPRGGAEPSARGQAPRDGGTSGTSDFTHASFGLGLPERLDLSVTRHEWFSSLLVLLVLPLGNGIIMIFFPPRDWTVIGTFVGVSVVACALTVATWWLLLRWKVARNQRGIRALEEQRLDEAAHTFESLAGSQFEGTSASPAYLHNLANTRLRMGQRALARRLFLALAWLAPEKSQQWLRAVAWESVTECEVLEGNTGRARVAIAEVRRSWADKRPYEASWPELLLALRTGDTSTAWRHVELLDQLPDPAAAPLRTKVALCRAFLLSRQEPPTQEQQQELARLQVRLRQARPGEFDYLMENWPELRAFVARSA